MQSSCLSRSSIRPMQPLARFAAGACMALAAMPALAAGPRLDIQVVPRIGLFNELLFAERFARDPGSRHGCRWVADDEILHSSKLSWFQYRNSIDKEDAGLSASFDTGANAPAQDWDALVTSLFGTKSAAQCGYRVRRVHLKVHELPDPKARCRFRIAQHASDAFGACEGWYYLASNLEEPVEVEIALGSDNKIVASAKGTIPEDFLVVSLGDSYASGEGNPDIPVNSKLARDYFTRPSLEFDSGIGPSPAIWMDPWCHRSAWAGPIQAALKIRQRAGELPMSESRDALERGAYTVVSLACSGAKVTSGILQDYEGTTSFKKFREVYRIPWPETGLPVTIPPQLNQLANLLGEQEAGKAKKRIDLLVLDGGGNDMLFAPAVTAITTVKLGKLDPAHRDELDRVLEDRKRRLPDWYDDIDGKLRQLLTRADAGAAQALFTTYPDPFWRDPQTPCEGALSDSMLGLLAKTFGISMDAQKAEYLKSHLLDILNAEVLKEHRSWLPVITSPQPAPDPANDVRNHGWCQSGSAGYAKQNRWFRNFADSHALQGNYAGTFHPTWETHVNLYATAIAEAAVASLKQEPLTPPLAVAPQAQGADGRWYVSGSPRFFVDSANDQLFDKVRVTIGAQTELACVSGGAACAQSWAFADGASIAPAATATSRAYRRDYRARALPTFVVDASPPSVSCKDPGGDASVCDGSRWTRALEIELSAKDEGSGLARDIEWRWKTGADAWPDKMNVSPSLPLRLPLPDRGDGALQVCAQDRVGNKNAEGCVNAFRILVDRRPPQVTRVIAQSQRVDLGDSRVIPANAERKLSLELTADDADSGVRTAGGCQLTTPVSWSSVIIDSPPFETDFGIQDCAGNEMTPYKILPIAKRSGQPVRSAAQWRGDTQTALKLAPKLALLASGYALASTDELNATATPRWPLLAAWLNLLDGRIGPYQTVDLMPTGLCGDARDGMTYFELLLSSERCLAAASDPAAASAAIAAAFQAIGIIKADQ